MYSQRDSAKRWCGCAQTFQAERCYDAAPFLFIRPGTRLVRQWGDRVHLVNVQANGYEYQGNRYQSLSEIARLITGTRWSGPLFFGIKHESANAKSQELQ